MRAPSGGREPEDEMTARIKDWRALLAGFDGRPIRVLARPGWRRTSGGPILFFGHKRGPPRYRWRMIEYVCEASTRWAAHD